MSAVDRARHESVQWVPQCPACGAGMSETVTVLGDDMAPKTTQGVQGRTVQCDICGYVAVIGPAIGWLTLEEVRGG
ncbi:MAG TPA: hypothetical protein VGA36_00295 [Nitriliruptorales bacterium]